MSFSFSKIAQRYKFFCRDKWEKVASTEVDLGCSVVHMEVDVGLIKDQAMT
uniref:Uncharacterized protein n=1 Tax=Triticum urartu TaxID=4572 RepID=A0A8R7VBD1_TRIUA